MLLAILIMAGSTAFASAQTRWHISGTVVEEGSGEPVIMASVVIRELSLWAVTDENGFFSIENVPAGTHKLSIDLLGYEPAERQVTVKGNVEKLSVALRVSSLALDEVVVTAKEGGGMTSASRISKQTIEHIQPSSLKDVMQLLPGSVTENPSLTQVNSISIRYIGNSAANAAGTALIVDGASFSNDANLQMLSTSTAANSTEENVSSTAGGGVDTRQISTDNIESVEVIRGIPSVVYGDMTSGAVVVKTKAGVTPWEVRVKSDPQLKQVSVGKGFNLGEKNGVLNFDADYARAYSDVRTPASAYNRFNFQTGWSKTFAKVLTFNAKLRGNWSNATDASDPDLILDEIAQERDRGLRLNINGRWVINRPWITNVEYLVAGSITDQYSRSRKYQGTAGYTPTSSAMYDAEREGFFTPAQYYSDVSIYGRPVDAQARVTSNQLGVWGDVKNKVLAGFEWKTQGNTGRGKVFDLTMPPSPGDASSFRERSYSDIPFLHSFTGYVEDNIKLPLFGRELEVQAGVRAGAIAASGIDTRAFFGLEPRFNGRYCLVKRGSSLRDLSIRAGWGKSFKMPSMVFLYPEPAYKDMVSFSYNDFDASGYGMNVITTKMVETVNPDLKPQQSRNIEAGIDFDAGSVSGSLVFFDERMRDGYDFVTEYAPMPYRRFGYTWKGDEPSQQVLPSGLKPEYSYQNVSVDGQRLPYITDTTFMKYTRPVNGVSINKWGVEFTLDVAQIKAINTSVNVSGAYMNITTLNDAYTQKLYTGSVNGRTFPYVGVYSGSYTTSNGSVRERLSTNLRFVTHIPSLAMVVTLTAQGVFLDRNRYLCRFDGTDLPYFADGTWKVNPLYIIDRAGRMQPFTDAMAADSAYRNLILTTNTETYYLRQGYPFYGMLNIRLSKEIRKVATVSFYANNFLNFRGRVRNSVTNYPTDKNTPIYFGAEVKISIK